MNSYVYRYWSYNPRTREKHFIVGGYFDAPDDQTAAEMVRQRESGEVENTNPWLMGSGPYGIWRHEPIQIYEGVTPPAF